MNYLAHAYLSFGHPEILLGNMISDFVKGKKKFDYPLLVQNGITLHRAIDDFTDNHESTKKAKSYFKPFYGLYAGAFIDIVYDYFLANDEKEFSPGNLLGFSTTTYQQLEMQRILFPEKFAAVFYYMQLHNWLYNYQFKEGIIKSFGGLVHRALYIEDSSVANIIFENNFDALKNCYADFFPALKQFSFERFKQLPGFNE
ncbi:MAG TPA: ACP phosphodiesterase [Puia sp.]|nr:ACP phosphodiesterase [Puia sp.]